MKLLPIILFVVLSALMIPKRASADGEDGDNESNGWIELIGDDGPSGFANIGKNIELCGDVSFDPDSELLKPVSGKGVVAVLKKWHRNDIDNLLTEQSYGDVEVQFEFLIGKGSNSGIKLQQRYEIQLFDSFGNATPTATDCGGIYPHWKHRTGFMRFGLTYVDDGFPPTVNAAKPAGEWQSLKIIFTAPRFNANGKKSANAKFESVVLNGKTIHENIELNSPTGNISEPLPEVATASMLLQTDHGAVAFRKMRVRSLEDEKQQSTE